MTRAEQISHLQLRYRQAASQHKRKTMTMILVRLSHLMTKQLKAEIRAEKRKVA